MELVSDKHYLCYCWISASRAAQLSYLTLISLIWGAEETGMKMREERSKLKTETGGCEDFREHISGIIIDAAPVHQQPYLLGKVLLE